MEEKITLESFTAEELKMIGKTLAEALVTYAPRAILAFVLLFIGFRVSMLISRFIDKQLAKRKLDMTFRPFLVSLLKWSLQILVVISAASMLGIETTSFVAVLGAAGLAIGLALQGTLSNFAGGMLILLLRPYKVGDLVEVEGETGHVLEIQIFNTYFSTFDNRMAIIPNGKITDGKILNYTRLGKRRVDLVIGISYDSDIRIARDALIKVMKAHPLVLDDPEPIVGVLELADSGVNLAVRPYCLPHDYFPVLFAIQEEGKLALEAAGVTIPFPQVDVHMKDQ